MLRYTYSGTLHLRNSGRDMRRPLAIMHSTCTEPPVAPHLEPLFTSFLLMIFQNFQCFNPPLEMSDGLSWRSESAKRLCLGHHVDPTSSSSSSLCGLHLGC